MFCDFNSPKLSCILKDEKAAETNLTSLKLPMASGESRGPSHRRGVGNGAGRGTWLPKAIKIIKRPEGVSGASVAGPYLRELLTMSDLNCSDFFIRIYGWWEDAASLYIVMELMGGGNLGSCGAISETRAKAIMKRLLQATKVMHAGNIVHRDLKVQNILLPTAGSNNVKIADMGSSRCFDGPRACSNHHTTYSYLAPELFHKKACNAGAADIWSLGCVAYTMLIGVEPTPNDSGSIEEYSVPIMAELARNTRVSAGAEAFIRKLMTMDPGARPGAEDALKEPWLA